MAGRCALTIQVAFEVQTYRRDSWLIEAVYDDEGLAIEDALRLNRRTGSSSVRVVRETYDFDTEQSSFKVLYRSPDHVKIGGPSTRSGPYGASTGRGSGKGGASGPALRRPPKNKESRFSPMTVIALLLAAFVGLFVVINYLGS